MLVWQNRDIARHTTHWLREPIPWPVLGQEWLSALGKGFIALHFNDAQLLTFGRIGVVGLILYAFYYFYTQSAPRIWLLISGLAGTAFLPFLAADLLWGGRRTLSDRYFMLCYVCIYLVVAFLLVSKMQAQRGSLLWRAVTLGLLTVSLVSATTGAFGTSWWGWSEYEREIPPIVQGVDRPLVVVSVEFFDSFRFAHQFQPQVDLLILDKSAYFTLPQDHENIFFYGPNPAFLAQLRALGLKLNPVYQFIDPSTKFTLEVYHAKLSDREIPQALAPSGQSKAQ
jgi:hypothetical protein